MTRLDYFSAAVSVEDKSVSDTSTMHSFLHIAQKKEHFTSQVHVMNVKLFRLLQIQRTVMQRGDF